MLDLSEVVRRESEAADLGPTTVLYIGGEGRSGSTMLSTILGTCEGIVSIGEFRNVWKALKQDELCGCGAPISRCEFWTAVGEQAFGGWLIDVDAMLAADAKFARHRSIPRYVISRSRADEAELRTYRSMLGQLYRAVRAVSGCRIVVDSTKRAPYAYLLRDVPGIDLRVVHLVRDSRGVAYSSTKAGVERPEVTDRSSAEQAYMPSQPVWRTAIDWLVKNLLFYAIVPASKRRLVKYERLVSRPSSELAGILQLAGAPDDLRSSLDVVARSFDWSPLHTLGGNPIRFSRGRVRLEADDEWRSRMNRVQRFVVSLITFPLLVVYGYVSPPTGGFLVRSVQRGARGSQMRP